MGRGDIVRTEPDALREMSLWAGCFISIFYSKWHFTINSVMTDLKNLLFLCSEASLWKHNGEVIEIPSENLLVSPFLEDFLSCRIICRNVLTADWSIKSFQLKPTFYCLYQNILLWSCSVTLKDKNWSIWMEMVARASWIKCYMLAFFS